MLFRSLVEAAAKLPGMESEVSRLALDLAMGKTHLIPSSGGSYETYALPMSSFEVFINVTADQFVLIDGAAQIIGAQENQASRRMLFKLFSALKPELVNELKSELSREGIVISPRDVT